MSDIKWAKAIMDKVDSGKTVSESDLLRANEILISEVEKETLPKFAKNQTELAKIFKVDRKTIQRWRKEEGFPKPSSSGKWDVQATRSWIKANQRHDAEEIEDLHDLKVRQLKLICEKLEHEIMVKRGDYTPNDDVKRWVASMIQETKTVLLAIPSSMAPIVAGLEPADAEIRLRESIDEALKHLSSR
jgi:phage terminase Nu1 subunit (DNA packaging protein)